MIFPLVVVRSAGLPYQVLESPVFDRHSIEEKWQVAKEDLKHLAAAWPAVFNEALAATPDSALRTAIYNLARKVRKQIVMDRFLKIEYSNRVGEPPGELANAIAQWNQAIEAETDCKHRFEAWYDKVLTDEITHLQQIASSETLQKALLFTSHDLLKQLPVWTQKAVADFDKKDRRIARSVWQYVVRATYKTVPRSRFATVGVYDRERSTTEEMFWAEGNLFEESGFNSSVKNISKITPNVAVLPLIYDALLKTPAFFYTLKIVLNPCISNTKSTDYEWLYYDGIQESFQQTAQSDAIDFIIKTLLDKSQVWSFSELLVALTTATGHKESSEAFLLHLTDTGFLEWVWPENGLSPNWCSNLYNYLGWLTLEPVIVAATQVLQWLKTTARTLAFQSVEQSIKTLKESAEMLNGFLQKYEVNCPPIAPEQVFYEDVSHYQESLPYQDDLEQWVEQLSRIVEDSGVTPTTVVLHGHGAVEHTKLRQFLRENYPPEGAISFTEFSKKYIALTKMPPSTALKELEVSNIFKKNFTQLKLSYQFKNIQKKDNLIKTGVLLQVFRENGQNKVVVNAIYPGGGKLLARWLHLFDAHYSRVVAEWNIESAIVAFPWHHWSNAAFQPDIGMQQISAPGNRVPRNPDKPMIAWSNLFIRYGENAILLYDSETGNPVQLVDLGLNAPDSRPPIMRLLWAAGGRFPFVKAPAEREPVETRVGEWLCGQTVRIEKQARIVAGDLVLKRAVWYLYFEAATATNPHSEDTACVFHLMRNCLRHWGIPRYCFVQVLGNMAEKPQFIDQESPIAMQIFEKVVKKYTEKGLLITEMLPTPENAVGSRAEEIAIEF